MCERKDNITDREFARLFERYMAEKRDAMKKQFNRVLPTGELFFNRFEKAPYLHCGDGSSVYDTSVVLGDVDIGDNVWVGPYTLLDGANAKLSIGNYVSIDAGVMIYTHDTTKKFLSGGKEPVETGPVTIGNCCVIGTMAMISCNVTIGNHCVVGAHTLVKNDIPDYSIVAGVPGKIVGTVQIDEDGKTTLSYE